MEWLVTNLFSLLPILPLLVFLALLLVFRKSPLKASLWTLVVFVILTIFFWQKMLPDIFVSHNGESSLAQAGGSVGNSRETGINLYEVNDWQPAWVFVDLMKMARNWSDCGKWDEKTTVPLDSNGYPTAIPYGSISCVQTIWAHDWSHWPTGTYTLTFEGSGTISLKGKNYSSTGGKVSFPINLTTADNAPILKITKSGKANPIRNMHFVMPGYVDSYETQIFHPKFLEGLQGVDEIRFMNWMRTNWEWSDSEPTPDFFNWNNRTKTTSFTQSRAWGVAPEYIVALANRLNADAWINIPYTASNDFVTNYAKFLNDNLNPGLKVYIEYSNELWNGGTYRHYKYASDKGVGLGLETDIIAASRAYHIYRTMQIFKIFKDQFADDSRLINLVASQAANSWWGKQLLQYLDNPKYNPYGIKVDALAIAPYFGTSPNPTANSTVDDILNLSQQGVYSHTQAWTRSNMAMIKEYCNKKGLADKCIRLVTYEGGQHLRSSDTTINDKFIEANRREKMGQLFDEMFNVWEAENPGGLFTIFVYSSPYGKHGSWGMFEYQDQMNTPKYSAYRKRLDGSYVIKCVENWSCGSWSPTVCPQAGMQTRSCTDLNSCGTVVNKPSESISCTFTTPTSVTPVTPVTTVTGGGTSVGGNTSVTNSGGGSGSFPSAPTESQISVLQEQVLKLQKILAALLAQRSSQPEDDQSSASHYFAVDLRFGSRGQEVKSLQIKLNDLGYIIAQSGSGSPGAETEYFGSATKKALIRYQLDKGLILSSTGRGAGLFGPKTRASLNAE